MKIKGSLKIISLKHQHNKNCLGIRLEVFVVSLFRKRVVVPFLIEAYRFLCRSGGFGLNELLFYIAKNPRPQWGVFYKNSSREWFIFNHECPPNGMRRPQIHKN